MASGDKILSSDYNDLYERLNQARNRAGMGNVSYTPVQTGDPANSTSMLTFKSDVDLSRQNKYLANSTSYTPGNTLDVGQKILYSNLTLAQATLTSMQNVCINDSIHSTNGTFGDFGDCSTNSTNSTASNRINAVNSSNFSTHGGSNTQFGSG